MPPSRRVAALAAHLRPAPAAAAPEEPAAAPAERTDPAPGAPFPFVRLRGGSAREIGLAHGRQLAKRVRGNVEWYTNMFQTTHGYTEAQLRSIAGGFETAIRAFSSDYADEIAAIAEGAGVERWQTFILNARTEIMQAAAMGRPAEGPTECTALYSESHSVLAQNWDWDLEAESLTVLLESERTDTGRKILQICEPGILGKAGLNDDGVGVTLNILGTKELHGDAHAGVPVHVLLRAVLDCSSVEEAIETVEQAPKHYGCQSCFIVGGPHQDYAILELNGEETDTARQCVPPVHTNHYCGLGGTGVVSDASKRSSTTARYDRACALVEASANDLDVDATKSVLLDNADSDWPVKVPWGPASFAGMRVGTVTSIVMDLPARVMHVTPGGPYDHDFVELALV